MRYALIAVAIGASLSCVFVAWRLWLGEQVVTPGYENDPDYTYVVVLVVAATVLAFAAGGLIARRAEGAYLLSIAAFMLAMPLALLAILSLGWYSPYSTGDPGLVRFLGLGLLALDLWVAVQGIRVGRRLSMQKPPLSRRTDPPC